MFRICSVCFLLILLPANNTYTLEILIDEQVCKIDEVQEIDDFDSEIQKGDAELLNYVKNKYEKELFGLQHMFFPAKKPKKLYIILNGATKNRYSMWSWFWDSKEKWGDTAFLFLKDDTTKWYIGTHDKPLIPFYMKLINYYVAKCGINNKQIFMLGSSMGGYASLVYGILLEAQAIFAFRPQIDYPNALLNFGVKGLEESWIDLNELIKKSHNIPKIYLNYGNFLPDKQAAHQFIDTLKELSSILVIHKTSNPKHVGFNPSKSFIEATLNYLEKITLDGKV